MIMIMLTILMVCPYIFTYVFYFQFRMIADLAFANIVCGNLPGSSEFEQVSRTHYWCADKCQNVCNLNINCRDSRFLALAVCPRVILLNIETPTGSKWASVGLC